MKPEKTNPVTALPKPIEVRAVVVLVRHSHSGQKQWHPETMDRSSAERLVTTVTSMGGEAKIVEVPLVMPAASDIDDSWDAIDCDPVHVELAELVLHGMTATYPRPNIGFVQDHWTKVPESTRELICNVLADDVHDAMADKNSDELVTV